MIEQYKSRTYYTFMDQLNNFEDNQMIEISKAVNSFCELPTKDKLDSLTLAFKNAKASLEFLTKNMKAYVESGKSDITKEEMALLLVYLADIGDSLKFEAETVEQVIEDETYNAAFALRQAALESGIVTS